MHAVERLANLSDEVTEGRSSVRAEEESVERGGSIVHVNERNVVLMYLKNTILMEHWSSLPLDIHRPTISPQPSQDAPFRSTTVVQVEQFYDSLYSNNGSYHRPPPFAGLGLSLGHCTFGAINNPQGAEETSPLYHCLPILVS